MKIATFRRRIRELAAFSRPGPILDVGCAHGFFLEAAAEAGWTPFGVEISDWSAAWARRRFGDRIACGDLRSTAFPDGFFRAVTMFDALEHLPDPAADLREVARILAPDGILMLTTIDRRSLSGRLMGRFWPHLKPEHVLYPSRLAMRTLLGRCGFDMLCIRPAVKTLTLRFITAYFRTYPLPVVSPALSLLGRILPTAAADCPLPTVFGEMLVVARRREGRS